MRIAKRLIKRLIPEKQRLGLRYSFFRLRGLYYIGSTVECVCCEQSFRQFLPYGSPPRANAVCPNCHSLERNRLLWLYLQREVGIGKIPLRILHFAPEPILQKRLLRTPKTMYISTDLCSPFAMVQADIMDLPFEDASFDLVLISHVLAHVPDDKKALSELRRILSSEGLLLLQEQVFPEFATTNEQPNSDTPEKRLQAHGQDDRFRNYGLDFTDRLREQGFEVEQIDYRDQFSADEQFRYGLSRQELIFRCHKTC